MLSYDILTFLINWTSYSSNELLVYQKDLERNYFLLLVNSTCGVSNNGEKIFSEVGLVFADIFQYLTFSLANNPV